MNTNWELKKISDICNFQNSKRIPLKSLDREKRQGEYPYYGASGIVDYIDDYVFDGKFLLISEDGENLRTRNTPIAFQAEGKFWVNNHAHILSEKENGILDYLEYYFSVLNVNPYITGAVQPKLNKANLDTIEISVPPLNQRLQINKILNSLKEKINLNNQINQTLESIAQAIFKSWFIDFEPVKAKIAAKLEGKDPEVAAMCAISGKSEAELELMPEDDFAELKVTAALFPDDLMDSDLGEVPIGWKINQIKDVVVELRRGITPKYTESEKSIIVLNQKCIRNHTINFSFAKRHDNFQKKVDGRELKVGDVLVNSTGVGTLGRISPVRYLSSVTVVDSHITVVRANEQKISSTYLQRLFMEKESFIESSGAGTTGQTELRKEILEDIKFANPKMALHRKFEQIVSNQNKYMSTFDKMNISLSGIRDILLPKLLSGEIDVSALKEVTGD